MVAWGACMVAPGGVHGFSGGCMWLLQGAWFLRGACVVALGGCAWLLWGRCAWDTTRYADTVNERAVRILLECILVCIIVCPRNQ